MATQHRDLFYKYIFKLGDGRNITYDIELDNDNLDLLNAYDGPKPDWTKLEFHKCPNCTLVTEHCPIAVNLVKTIEFFRDSISYEDAEVFIETNERKYSKEATLQEGLSSIVGIYMVTSGCPIMVKLKPMVQHHLPFASEAETKYRVLSMYLLAQYFIQRNGGAPDWEMKKLVDIYDDIRIVNKSFVERLSDGAKVKDASLNALVNLDCFAMSISFAISSDVLDEIETLFRPYLK